jgi:hypothetical protein
MLNRYRKIAPIAENTAAKASRVGVRRASSIQKNRGGGLFPCWGHRSLVDTAISN